MNYRPRHFIVQELVPPDVYEARGEAAWELLDPRLLASLDRLRAFFGPVTVNNWHWGGAYRESGLRSTQTAVGARFSQHKFGRAADCKFRDVTPQEAFERILAAPDDFPTITCLEDVAHTPTWLHVDVRNCERIKVVKP